MHPLLRRQIRRQLGEASTLTSEWRGLLDAVDAAYEQFDADRVLLERSMELSSDELLQANSSLRRSISLQQATFDSTADGIVVATIDGRIVGSNRVFAEVWRIPQGVLDVPDSPQTVALILDRLADPEEFLALVKDTHTDPESESHAILECRDGRVIESDSLPQKVDDRSVGRVWSFRDVTERYRAELLLRTSEARYRLLFESNPQPMWVFDAASRQFLEVNEAAVEKYGYSRDEFLAMRIDDIRPAEDLAHLMEVLSTEPRKETGKAGEARHTLKDGRVIAVSIVWQAIDFRGRRARLVAIQDITEQKRSEAAALERAGLASVAADVNAALASAQLLPAMLQGCSEALVRHLGAALARVWTLDPRENVLELQATAGSSTRPDGQSRIPVSNTKIGRIASERVPRLTNDVLTDPELADREWATREGMVAFAGHPMVVDGELLGVVALFARRPLSEFTLAALANVVDSIALGIKRKLVETAVAARDEQLRQAQKMEAVGQLAGGIAHDFNNLLGVIMGYGESVMRRLPQPSPLRDKVGQILKASERAAGLTHQLLAFSRKQVLQPRTLDLKVVVGEMEKMLRRLISENIELITASADRLGRVNADPGQIEQILLNLTVNARDAMPRGGRLRVELANAELDAAYAQRHPDVEAGSYVVLAVSDTGHGMSRETTDRIFEPFFTTKESGKGTGLGLATVHGIVKQSGGHIFVYSELGQGTTFKIYLPRLKDAADGAVAVPVDIMLPRGSETVLLVEDEESLRHVVCECLTESGYRVVEAGNAEDAMDVVRRDSSIDIMITDVIMPGMSGRELAECAVAARPGLKVIYMSGYTDDEVVLQGVLREDMPFLQKPFSDMALARKMREVLDRGTPARGHPSQPDLETPPERTY